MKGKCIKANEGCTAPNGPCHESGDNHNTCEHWLKNNPENIATEQKATPEQHQDTVLLTSVNWSGNAFKIDDIEKITSRSAPFLIGIIGKADAGKTSFLGMLYTLLLNGKTFANYTFAGSKTIIGWDELYQRLKLKRDKIEFPDPTPPDYFGVLHLAFRNAHQQLTDVLFTDASGEVFYRWSQNKHDDTVKNVRWIDTYAHGFVLFIDCEDLMKRKNVAKEEVIGIAEMLKSDLRNRPMIAVWSKAEEKHKVDTRILKALEEELNQMFDNYEEKDISNLSKDDPDDLVHKNNMEVIDWLLSEIDAPKPLSIHVTRHNSNDLFLNYRGHE